MCVTMVTVSVMPDAAVGRSYLGDTELAGSELPLRLLHLLSAL